MNDKENDKIQFCTIRDAIDKSYLQNKKVILIGKCQGKYLKEEYLDSPDHSDHKEEVKITIKTEENCEKFKDQFVKIVGTLKSRRLYHQSQIEVFIESDTITLKPDKNKIEALKEKRKGSLEKWCNKDASRKDCQVWETLEKYFEKKFEYQKLKLLLICAKNAEVLEDVLLSLDEDYKKNRSLNKSDNIVKLNSIIITIKHISIKTPAEIITALSEKSIHSKDFDLVAIIRGGGDGIDIFDYDEGLLKAIAEVEIPIVSAIGHMRNRPLVQELVDHAFDVPYAFGIWLKERLARTHWKEEENKDELDHRQKLIQQRDTEISTLKEKLQRRDSEIKEFRRSREQEFAEREREITELQKNLASRDNQITGLKKNLACIEQELTERQQHITELDNDIEQEINDLNEQIQQRDSEINTLTSQLAHTEQQIQEKDNEIPNLNEELQRRNEVRRFEGLPLLILILILLFIFILTMRM
jgi:hypothetical protein